METLNIAGITLQGFAQGGRQTSIFCPEVQAVFDAGCILPKVNVDHYFITHAHPDHIGALPAIVAKRAVSGKQNTLHIHVNAEISSKIHSVLTTMASLYGDRAENTKFQVHGRFPGNKITLKNGFSVIGLSTFHHVPSMGWAVEHTTKKLKPEFVGKSAVEITNLHNQGVSITEDKTSTLLVIPGDTQIDFLLTQEKSRKAKVLLHEVTVWDDSYGTVETCRQYGHTHVEEMAEHCEKFEGEALVLVHRSMRYSRLDIEEIAKKKFPKSILNKLYFFDGGDS